VVRRRTRRINRYAKIVGSIPTGGISFAFLPKIVGEVTWGKSV